MTEQMEGQMSLFDPDIWSGKTFPELSAPTKEKISEPSLKKPRGSQIKMPLFLDLRGGGWRPCGLILGDGWSIAWRVHDAQYWGVPQRRKRICLLADFGGDTAGKILFELQRETANGDTEQAVMDIGTESRSEVQSVAEGLFGDTETCGEPGKDAAADAGIGTTETGGCLNGWDVQSKHIQPENGIAESLYAGECKGGGGESYVMQSRAISFQNANETGTAETLVATDYKDPQIVAYGLDRASYNQGMNAKYDFSVDEEKVGTCVAKGPNAVCKAVDCLNGRGKM